MRVATHLRSGEVGFNMTPMIDVVFLLIIFFLVSSHLAQQETQLDLPLPVADSAEEPPPVDKPRVTINILSDGELLLSGRRVGADALTRRLSEARQDSGDDLEVRIRCHRSAPYGQVEPVLASTAAAGLWDVVFSVYRSEDVR